MHQETTPTNIGSNDGLGVAAEREADKLNAKRYHRIRQDLTRLLITSDPVCMREEIDLKIAVRCLGVFLNFRETVPDSVDKPVDAALLPEREE